MKRRSFLNKTVQAIGGLSLGFLPGKTGFGKESIPLKTSNQARIVLAQSNFVKDANRKLISGQVHKLLDTAMQHYFQVTKPETAWRKIIKKNDVVGIKVNCLAGRGMSTSTELVDAIVESLRRAGIPDRHIIIWDRANRDLEKAGYKIQTNSTRVRCYGHDHFGYSYEVFEYGEVGSCLSNILLEQLTAVINVPILKDHGIVGITNALKNFFGAIHNPNKYHDNAGDPYIADVNMLHAIRSKTRITISDALTAQYEGGPPFMPQWAWPMNSLLVGTDPVALDTLGWDIIEKKRKEHGLPSLKEAGREPTYIATAADKNHQLGCNNLNKIDIQRI